MEQSWLYAPGVPSSAPGQAIQLPNPRPYATHSRAVLTWIFNSASGKVVGQQIRLGWWYMQRPSCKENSQKCVGACSLQQSSCLEAGFRPPPSHTLCCIVAYPYMPDESLCHSISWRVEVLLSFWQRLAAAGDPLMFVDAHAGAGVYELSQGAATFHRNLGFRGASVEMLPRKWQWRLVLACYPEVN